MRKARLLVLGLAVVLIGACSAGPPDGRASNGPLVNIGLEGLRVPLDCRGVDQDTCVAVGEEAAAQLPGDAIITRARLAPAQNCYGQAPCIHEPPDCHVFASVLFDTHLPNAFVVNIVGPPEDLQVSDWTESVELGVMPIQDKVGSFCTSDSAEGVTLSSERPSRRTEPRATWAPSEGSRWTKATSRFHGTSCTADVTPYPSIRPDHWDDDAGKRRRTTKCFAPL